MLYFKNSECFTQKAAENCIKRDYLQLFNSMLIEYPWILIEKKGMPSLHCVKESVDKALCFLE